MADGGDQKKRKEFIPWKEFKKQGLEKKGKGKEGGTANGSHPVDLEESENDVTKAQARFKKAGLPAHNAARLAKAELM